MLLQNPSPSSYCARQRRLKELPKPTRELRKGNGEKRSLSLLCLNADSSACVSCTRAKRGAACFFSSGWGNACDHCIIRRIETGKDVVCELPMRKGSDEYFQVTANNPIII